MVAQHLTQRLLHIERNIGGTIFDQLSRIEDYLFKNTHLSRQAQPQPHRATVITRYVTAPLLAIADVGSYAFLLGGLPGATPSLVARGLTHHQQPLLQQLTQPSRFFCAA
jgi:hypothetical protein